MLPLGSSGDTPGDDDFEEGQFEIGPFTQMTQISNLNHPHQGHIGGPTLNVGPLEPAATAADVLALSLRQLLETALTRAACLSTNCPSCVL